MMRLTNIKHSLLTRILHWVCAFFIFALFISGWIMVDLDYHSSWYQTLPDLHILGGTTLLLLWSWTVIRLFINKKASLVQLPHQKHEIILSAFIKYLFYPLVLIILICGYLMATADGKSIHLFHLIDLPALSQFSANQIDIFGWVHKNLSYLLMILVCLHILGAVKHHYVDKDSTLKRML